MLLEIVCGLGRVEHDRGVEEREEHDQRQIAKQEQRPSVTELRRQPLKPFRTAAGVEIGNRGRQQQQRGSEDRRNHARGIELQRQMRGLALEHLVADLALRILDQEPPLRALHEHDEGDHHHRHDDDDQDQRGGQRALASQFQHAGERRRQFRDDAGEDDQRNAVADTARGDLLAEPHQEHGAAGQGDRGRDQEEHAGFADHIAGALQSDGDAIGLEHGENHREIAGILIQRLAAGLAFLLQGFELRRHGGQQLDDDRCRDIRHDVQRKDRHAVDAAAGEHVEHAEDTAGLRLEHLLPDRGIDAGQRDIGAEPVNKQRPQCKPDALLQFFGFSERREVQVCRKLFCC